MSGESSAGNFEFEPEADLESAAGPGPARTWRDVTGVSDVVFSAVIEGVHQVGLSRLADVKFPLSTAPAQIADGSAPVNLKDARTIVAVGKAEFQTEPVTVYIQGEGAQTLQEYTAASAGKVFLHLEPLTKGGTLYLAVHLFAKTGPRAGIPGAPRQHMGPPGRGERLVMQHLPNGHPHLGKVCAVSLADHSDYSGLGEQEAITFMHFYPNGDLNRELKPAEILDYGLQAAEGIQALHQAGLAWGDAKPENLMLDGDGQLRLVDFDTVWHIDDLHEAIRKRNWLLVNGILRTGTAGFVPDRAEMDSVLQPMQEGILDGTLDADQIELLDRLFFARDIYALGVTLLCWQISFSPAAKGTAQDDPNNILQMNEFLGGVIRYYRNTSLSAMLINQLMQQMLAVNPMDRPEIGQVVEQLRALREREQLAYGFERAA